MSKRLTIIIIIIIIIIANFDSKLGFLLLRDYP